MADPGLVQAKLIGESGLRDRWYSDNRDLVKWASLVHLAQEADARTIVQVAFYRPELNRELLRDNKIVSFPSIVQEHFPRRLEKIEDLGAAAGIEIKVHDSVWPGASRDQYIDDVVDTLRAFGAARLIAFLDPDTGIARAGTPGLKRIKSKEVNAIFKALKPKDWLAFYQHGWHQRGWIESTRKEFAKALGIPEKAVHTFSCEGLAKDVVLFAVERKQN